MTKKEDEGKMSGGHDLAARRARLRTSLAKQPSSDLDKDELVNGEEKISMNEATVDHSIAASLSKTIENVGTGKPNISESIGGQSDVIKFLSHIDQALHACVEHLSTMHILANKQSEELRLIVEALQRQGISASQVENLGPLMESLTAAIEPMKAIGELVPAVDKLVSSAEMSEQFKVRTEANNDKLVVCLAEQLFGGHITADVFQSAYQAIFPDDDSITLTQRLGDLLDTQQLSGELFEVAFQALSGDREEINHGQAAEKISQEVFDKEREDFALREEELNRLLSEKEEEVDGVRRQMESRWSELAIECDSLKKSLETVNSTLQVKETELSKKLEELAARDSENQQLKAQIEELKDKTKEMMTDLQRQLAKKQEEAAVNKQSAVQGQEASNASSKQAQQAAPAAQSGFFDFVNTGNANNPLFANNSASVLSGETDYGDTHDTQVVANATPNQVLNPISSPAANPSTAASAADWQPVDIKASGRPIPAEQLAQQVASGSHGVVKASTSNQLTSDAQANTQASASFVSAVGSYGSGVRAQVFEVIVRQALAGTQWREICAVPMQSNNISAQEVEAEVKRRQALLKK